MVQVTVNKIQILDGKCKEKCILKRIINIWKDYYEMINRGLFGISNMCNSTAGAVQDAANL